MLSAANAREPLTRRRLGSRLWLAVVVSVALALLASAGAVTILSGPQPSSSAGACSEVSSAACRPFLDAVYAELGQQGDEVASVRGRPWCGEDECGPVYGAEMLRLRVTYGDGTTAEYSCWRGVLTQAHCEPVDRSGGS